MCTINLPTVVDTLQTEIREFPIQCEHAIRYIHNIWCSFSCSLLPLSCSRFRTCSCAIVCKRSNVRVPIALLHRTVRKQQCATPLSRRQQRHHRIRRLRTPCRQYRPRNHCLLRPRLPRPRSEDSPVQPVAEPTSPPRAPVTSVGDSNFPLVDWFREQTLIKVGAIIFFLGAAWFVGLAFEENWISPLGRIVLGLALGVLVALIGYTRATVDRIQYLTLTALGAGVVIATVYASQFAFAPDLLLPPPFAFFYLAVHHRVYTCGKRACRRRMVGRARGCEWLPGTTVNQQSPIRHRNFSCSTSLCMRPTSSW